VKRRDFLSLCGLAAGSCLVPDAIARAIRDTCVLADRPYLILPRNPSSTLYALTTDGTTDFMLHYGDPFAASNPPTWNEYFEEHRSAGALGVDPAHAGPAGRDEQERASQYEGIDIKDKEAVREWWIEQVGDPEDDPITIKADEEIDGAALEKWEWQQEISDGPSARAFHLLSDLPLDDGRGPGKGSALGKLRFIEGDRPGSNLTYVEAPDLATLACLQNRLNELDENLAIEIREW
jgi:hypothetical protein